MAIGEILKRKVFGYMVNRMTEGLLDPFQLRHKVSQAGLKIGGREFGRMYTFARNLTENTGKGRYIPGKERPGAGTIVDTPWDLGGEYSFRVKVTVKDPSTGEFRDEFIGITDDDNLVMSGRPVSRERIEGYATRVWEEQRELPESERLARYEGEVKNVQLETIYSKM